MDFEKDLGDFINLCERFEADKDPDFMRNFLLYRITVQFDEMLEEGKAKSKEFNDMIRTEKEKMNKAIDRAVGYIDDEKLYNTHLYYAQQLGELAGYDSKKVLELVKKQLSEEHKV